MTSQPQLSTTPAATEVTEAASAAAQVPAVASPVGTTDLIEPALSTPSAPVNRGLWQWFGSPGRKPLLLGLAGSLLLAFGGLGAGGVLRHDPVLQGTPLAAWRFGHGYNLSVIVSYVGLWLAVWAWVLLGRDVLARRSGGRAVLTTALAWILPMVVTPPLFTRDPYSYLAYGTLALRGHDPYVDGPIVLTGPIADNVHWFWTDTPSPYGPLFIALAKLVASVTGTNMIPGVILMRLVMMVGLVLFVVSIPGLCRHLGGRTSVAMWIAVANPVMVMHLIGGPHNDLLLVGFLSSGSLLVLNRKHVAGISLVTLAMAVKGTAGFALPFLVLVWAARMKGDQRKRILKAIVAGFSVFLVVFTACSLVAKVGLGWLPALVAPTNIVNWLSLPTGVGQLVFTVINWMFGGVQETPIVSVFRAIGVLIFLVVAVRQWLASRDGGPDAVRRAGVVLLLFTLLSPATLPWYFSWGIALLAATAWTARGMSVVIAASIFLVISAFPSGEVSLYAFGYMILSMIGAFIAAKSLRKPDPLGLRRKAAAPVPTSVG
ncbi:polyprenol phosphomannose-dependent alpha 1,6 mannosyltransferase MptB [Pseudonocardia spinosispora]|uniref:polyprenol phosphomannose-dependent alpha 1,6 mannosyltransferase MptB n=1 Tax=Pseudonocardia spinosispora TaxID=103441 RepID=UPI000407B5A9|nr:polyprenol phosphomannose-dependent alpha 1,6 mannosyltransferase MptB [Pseudonocardia spinosispora]